MKDVPNIGDMPPRDAERDAIHFAVIPVTLGQNVFPGQHVAIIDGHAFGAHNFPGHPIAGIIDPFRICESFDGLPAGTRVWLMLMPNTVTSLRHVWKHPLFDAEPATHPPQDKAESEAWLRAYAGRMNTYDIDPPDGDYASPEVAFQRLISGLKGGRLFGWGTDLHRVEELAEPDELKRHAENYLGIKIDWGKYEYTCSC